MLKDTITTDLATAMKARDQVAVETLRVLNAAIRNFEIDKQESDEATDEEIVVIIQKEAKKRREAIELYKQGNRDDLVKQESYELETLQKYLPEQLSNETIEQLVKKAIEQTGASSPQDMGKVMGALMPKVKGKADGKVVNQIVRTVLS
jgi:uncharacterized protein YqeY